MSSFVIKLSALLLMLVDHTAIALLHGGILERGTLYQTLRIIGRLAFPMFGFMLAEGVVRTKNLKKYLLRLGVFALLSEIPFDMVVFSRYCTWDHQNVYFTLILGVVSAAAIKWGSNLPGKKQYAGWAFAAAITVLCAALAEYVLHTDYTGPGVLMIAVMGLSAAPLEKIRKYFPQNFIKAFLFACAVILLAVFKGANEYYALIAVVFPLFYNGEKGPGGKAWQYTCYAFYPLHLLLLGLIFCLPVIH